MSHDHVHMPPETKDKRVAIAIWANGIRKWTPFVGQCGSRRKVESASQRYAAKDRDRIPA